VLRTAHVVVPALLLLSSCAAQEAVHQVATVQFESTPVGKALKEMRARHGGISALRRYAGVEFAYHAHHRDGTIAFDKVAIRFDNSRYLWMRDEADGGTYRIDLGAAPGGLSPTRLGDGGLVDTLRGKSAAIREPTIDFALRGLRLLFEPALMSAVGRWEFRGLVAPPKYSEDFNPVEVASKDLYVPEGPYLLETDTDTGLIARVLYRTDHPSARRRTQKVTFSDYATVSGFRLAHKRRHSRPPLRPAPNIEANPFRPSPKSIDVLHERIDNVRSLTGDEVERVCPEPDEGSLAEASLSGS